MKDIDLLAYIYWEYSLAVLIFSEIFKMLFAQLKRPFFQFIAVTQPKWITLFVAIVLMLIDWFFISDRQNVNWWQLIISFGLAVLGYDYGLKLIKETIRKIRDAFATKE